MKAIHSSRLAAIAVLIEVFWLFVAHTLMGQDDRAAAEWVIGMGGIVAREGGTTPIKTLEQLGDGPVEIASIEFWYTKDIRDKDLEKLKGLRKLSFLRFVGTPLTGAGFKHLAGLKTLHFLDVNASKIDNEGIQFLAELPELHVLWISCADVTDASAEHLAKITSLRDLAVVGCKITDKGLAVLQRLPNLKALNLDKTKVTADGIAELKKALPELNVVWTPPPPYISPELPRPLPPLPPLVSADQHQADLREQLQVLDADRYLPERIQSVDEVVDKQGTRLIGKVIEYGTHVIVIANAGRFVFKRSDVQSVALKRVPAAMRKPKLADLDVTYIERTPRMRSNHGNVDYRDGLPFLRSANPDLAHPPVGTEVTFTAHISNKGTRETGPFEYEMFLDDRSIAAGKLPSLAPAAEATASGKWIWEDGPHTVKCVVTPSTKIGEVCTRNNQLADRTDAFGFLICVTKESYDDYNSAPNMVESFSFEDWVQFHFEGMNRLFAESVYADAPNGCLARIRVDKFLYPNAATFETEKRTAGLDGHAAGFYYQGTWQFEKPNPFDPSYLFRVDWGFHHEMGHQLSLIDEYNWFTHLYDVSVKLENTIVRLNHWYSQMSTMMCHHGPHPFSELATLALNKQFGRPFGNYGDFLYAFPERCELHVLDRSGQAVSEAKVTFYQRRAPNWLFRDPPVSEAVTDGQGVLIIPHQDAPVHESVGGFLLGPNPCGKIDLVGQSNFLLAKVQFQQFTEWHWLEMAEFNVAALAGRKTHRRVIQTHFPSAGAPAAPGELRAVYIDEHTVDVGFKPVAGAKSYRLYVKKDHACWGKSPFTLIKEIKNPTLNELNVDASTTYLAVTSVDARGEESGLSNVVYCRRMAKITNIAVASDGTRYIPASEGRILRQRSDRTVDDWGVYAGDDWGLTGVAVTSAGNLAVTHSGHRLYLFTPAGEVIKSIGKLGADKQQFNTPRDVAVDRFDNLYVADTMNHRIQMFNRELVFQESLSDGFKEPRGVHVTRDGQLVVADTGNNRVLVYKRIDRQWKKVLAIDALKKPFDVASDSKGRIIVAEQDAQAVTVFDAKGKRLRTFDKLGPVHGLAVGGDDLILATTPYQRVHELR